MNPVILFDMDGVLADFTHEFTKLAHVRFGTPVVATEQQPSYHFTELGWTREQVDEMWQYVKGSTYFWLSLSPMVTPDIFKRIDRLNRYYGDVYFVTQRIGHDAREQTVTWLEQHGVFHPTVILARPHTKGKLAANLGAAYSIEDRLENAADIGRHGVASYLLDRPYNRGAAAGNVVRITSVAQYLDILEAAL